MIEMIPVLKAIAMYMAERPESVRASASAFESDLRQGYIAVLGPGLSVMVPEEPEKFVDTMERHLVGIEIDLGLEVVSKRFMIARIGGETPNTVDYLYYTLRALLDNSAQIPALPPEHAFRKVFRI